MKFVYFNVFILISVSLILPALSRPLHRSAFPSLFQAAHSIYTSATPSRLSLGLGSSQRATKSKFHKMAEVAPSSKSSAGESVTHQVPAVLNPPPSSRAALVICGPSGVGKDTIRSCLQQRFPDIFGYSVSHTTRKPRPDEINGVHYHFVNSEAMREEINSQKFVEHAEVHGSLYGTTMDALDTVWNSGRICILVIDITGVKQLKKSPSNAFCKYIFLMPPSVEELKKRLEGRATESDSDIEARIVAAEEEIKFASSESSAEQASPFDSVIVNMSVESTLESIVSSVREWWPDRAWA